MANFATAVMDTFRNLVANLGTARDKQSAGAYYLRQFSDVELSTLYRTSWMGRKVVDIPANDATRGWREWKADASQIEDLEILERKMLIQQKVKKALQIARLFGGAGLYIGIKNDDVTLPLQLDTIGKDSLEFVTVLPRQVLQAGEIVNDPLLPGYGKPEYYTVSGQTSGTTQIHASRIAIFLGNEILTLDEMSGTAYQGWGDPVLQSAYEAVRNADATASNIASLVYEAKVDVLQIPNLADIMADPKMRALLEERVVLAAQLKGNQGMLVIDGDEEHSQKSYNFSGLPDINSQALQAVSGAADIPVTRFLGQSPGGLNATGESDLRNYYDAVNSGQRLIVTPAMANLDEVLIRSALGVRPDDVYYVWASLWQMTDEQKSKISKETADTIKVLADTGLFPDEALSTAAANMLVEHSNLPEMEYTFVPSEEDDIDEDEAGATSATDGTTPRTLYIHRPVVNGADIVAWARSQGFTSITDPKDMHVTIAFSRTPVDWTMIGADWSSDKDGVLRVAPGGPRVMEQFGERARVLAFANHELQWRHESVKEKGASWEWDDYTPHITITRGDMPEDVEPYQGPIVLGPERFSEIQEDWSDNIEEITL